ncbi:protein kinase domain-containing protein [Nonomuraea glycinis]|uniref:protein kinase domain-containing protein n=1 Tax=Nonomuraea glycinis TaxID=2047744 RepID=UPI0033A8171E
MIGERVAGRFVIEAPLGSGGMGRVWRGRDRKLGRVVALKQVRADVGRLPELRARADQEARALARIDHPGIVRVHDVLDAPDGPWIVMDYVRGAVLGRLIADGPLPEPAVARIGAQVLDALIAAHAVGVLHRDVKPDNILITSSGGVVLVDFGIAAIEGNERITTLGQVIGTSTYMAPERLRGAPAGEAADLWSLGATLYTAVEGRTPFDRSTDVATRYAILDLPPDPMTRAHRLSPAITGLLTKDPATRMTAAELARRLEPLAGRAQPPPRPPAAKPTPPRETGAPSRENGAPSPETGAAPPRVRRTFATANAADRGSMVLALPPGDAAALLAQRSRLFTTAAVEEMCRRPAACAKLLQMLLPDRAGRLLDQVREPDLVAAVVLAMDPHHRGRVLAHMHDRHSAAAVRAMAKTDLHQTSRALATMPEAPAARLLTRLPPPTIADLLRHCPSATRGRLLSQLPPTTREEVERRLA